MARFYWCYVTLKVFSLIETFYDEIVRLRVVSGSISWLFSGLTLYPLDVTVSGGRRL